MAVAQLKTTRRHSERHVHRVRRKRWEQGRRRMPAVQGHALSGRRP